MRCMGREWCLISVMRGFLLPHPRALILLGVIGCLLACVSAAPPPVNPPPFSVHSEGQAILSSQGSKLLARRQALQDAIRQAALHSQAIVHSHTVAAQHSVLFDSFSLRTAAAVNAAQILDEWQEGEIYHVRALVSLARDGLCVPPYRRRIVATGFPLAHPNQLNANETLDVSSGIAREILHLLTASGEFLGSNRTQISLYPQPDQAPHLLDAPLYAVPSLTRVAAQEGAQFVLSGVIRDMQLAPGEATLGNTWLTTAKGLLRELWPRRSLALDVYVHDGFTGALLLQYRYADTVEGDVWLPASHNVGSEGFQSSAAGAKIHQFIQRASTDIRRALSCYPKTARIVKIDGVHLFIDAGAQEGLNIGDQWVVYANASAELHVENRQYIGRDKQPVAVLTLRDVKPRYAIGELEVPANQLGIRSDDWVRAW